MNIWNRVAATLEGVRHRGQGSQQKPGRHGCCSDKPAGTEANEPSAQKTAQSDPQAKLTKKTKGGSCCGS